VLPYDVKSKSIYELAAMVRDERPALLGTHDKALKGDLETIVDKALQKDRDQRYESAHALGADIQRYLSGEAITARTPSLAYHVRVLARRHKVVAGSVAAIFLMLVAGVLIVSRLYVKVDAESDRAQAAQQFLSDAMAAARPKGYGSTISAADLYDHVTREIDSAFHGEPELEAEVRQSIGLAYFSMSKPDEASEQLTKVVELRKATLGPYHRETVESMDHLESALAATGQLTERAQVYYDIWKAYEHNFGEEHDSTLVAWATWNYSRQVSEVDEKLDLVVEVRQKLEKQFGSDHKRTLTAQLRHAWYLILAGVPTEAEALARDAFDKAVRMNEPDSDLHWSGRRTLAASLLALGHVEEAAGLYEHMEFPAELQVEEVLQGSYDPEAHGTQAFVFWEIWCPYCLIAVPALDEPYQAYRDAGLDIIGLTSANEGESVEQVRNFLREKKVSYPHVRLSQIFWSDYGLTGVPYMWLFHDRKLVYEGHPGGIEYLFERILPALNSAGSTSMSEVDRELEGSLSPASGGEYSAR